MIKIAVVGSGFGLYGLLPAFNSVKGYKVVGFCAKKTPRVIKYCKSIGLKDLFTNWKIMIDSCKPDAIAIAVIPAEQFLIVQYAIKKGIHVFAEKPLTNDTKQAKQLVQLAKKNHVANAVDFIFPEIVEWQKCKQILDTKRLGKTLDIQITWHFHSYDLRNKIKGWKTDIKQGGGALSFYCSHVLYYIKWFLKDYTVLSAVKGTSAQSLNKGETSLVFSFKNKDTTGFVDFSCEKKKTAFHQLIFTCEKGALVLENKDVVTGNFKLTLVKNNISKEIKTEPTEYLSKEDERVKEVKKLINRFKNAILNKKKMTPDFSDGLFVQEKIKKIRKLIDKN